MIWFETGGSGHSYAVAYPSIGMHAVSSDAESFQRPCIYMQLDTALPPDDGDDDMEPSVPEIRIVPADPAARELPFLSFSATTVNTTDNAALPATCTSAIHRATQCQSQFCSADGIIPPCTA